MNEPVGDLEVVASLAEPIRRALCEYVAEATEAVSRDEAAAALVIPRQVAAYHLDRLAAEGVLEVEFRRLSGRSGPGAGRPSKLYRRSDRVYDVSIPPRRYELAARILLQAAGRSERDHRMLVEVARGVGREIGREGLEVALVATGYAPADHAGETRFRNCPFPVLRDQDRETTCGINLALVEGMVEGSGSSVTAVLAPEEPYCCVRLRPNEKALATTGAEGGV